MRTKSASQNKIKNVSEVAKIARRARLAGKTVVTTNGCFDILHIGHMSYLKFAKSLGDMLIVGINSDSSVKNIKGPLRPIVPERERSEMLASLGAVDFVFIFNDKTPNRWLKVVKPNIHVKGSDWTLKNMPERDIIEKIGGVIVLAPLVKGKSTTGIIKKVAKSHSKKRLRR